MDTILGIKIKKHSEGFSLCQSHYVEKVLQRFEHLNIKEANTPFNRSIKLGENDGKSGFVSHTKLTAEATFMDLFHS